MERRVAEWIVKEANRRLEVEGVLGGFVPRAVVIDNELLDRKILMAKRIAQLAPSVHELTRLARTANGVAAADARSVGAARAILDFTKAWDKAIERALPEQPGKPLSGITSMRTETAQPTYDSWLANVAGVLEREANVVASAIWARIKAEGFEEQIVVEERRKVQNPYGEYADRFDLNSAKTYIAVMEMQVTTLLDQNWKAFAESEARRALVSPFEDQLKADEAVLKAYANRTDSIGNVASIEAAIDVRTRLYRQAFSATGLGTTTGNDVGRQVFVTDIERSAGLVDPAQFTRFQVNGPTQYGFDLGG